MMPNVVRGDRMAGLMSYLAGPGRHNEHTEPHLVAGDPALMAWHDDAELGHDGAMAIARHLDQPRTAFEVDVAGGHVWHCSLSIRAEEGLLTDDQWNAIASDFVTAMGFDDNDGSKAPCRWVAIRHGVSSNGNDHIHLAVNLVREDGTKASAHRDFVRAQKAARALEVKYGLEELESAGTERATRGYNPAEREAQARARARAKYDRSRRRSPGQDLPTWDALSGPERRTRITAETTADQPRHALARTVRGCATAAQDEGEFVRRLRRAGVLVRPRFADGRTDVVTGYSVAARPQHGERAIWYGGGHLGRDLTLPRLRGGWPDDPTAATTAAAEWNAAKRGRRVVAPGREAREPDPKLWEQYSREIGALRETLRAVPIEDRDTWARVARDTAGAFAAWSQRVEAEPGPLAAAADALAKSAQTRHRPERPTKAGMVAVSGAAMLLASAARGGQGTAAQAIMLRQLANLAKAVHDVHRASGEARRAAEIAAAERNHLRRLAARLPQPVASGTGVPLAPEVAATMQRVQQGHAPAGRPGSPVPNTIEPTRVRSTTKPGADRGPER
ncbi:relaxase/mobilization nuclease domain-containing protein [Oerskovia enterophila]|uniref:relaxase/mobilization nuclease domain-containing protein n=1 Tax=Oerskovia enterophila TaxID=43678 RepID=UPI0033921BFC